MAIFSNTYNDKEASFADASAFRMKSQHNAFNSMGNLQSSSFGDLESSDSTDSGDSSHSSSSRSRKSSKRNQDRTNSNSNNSNNNTGAFLHSYKKPSMPSHELYLAMDCEMVACATGSMCARVVLVDWKGRILLDTYVKPQQPVTDYLTFVSGIREADLVNAPDFWTVRSHVKALLHGKVLVGHGLENDLASLKLQHPWWMIRDTAYYQPFMQLRPCGNGQSVYAPRRLKDLCHDRLNRDIQQYGKAHCPAEDAASALELYKTHRPRWESCVSAEIRRQRHLALQAAQAQQQQQMQLQHQLHLQQQQQQQQQAFYYGPGVRSVVY